MKAIIQKAAQVQMIMVAAWLAALLDVLLSHSLLSLLAFCYLLALKYCTGGVHAAWLPACLAAWMSCACDLAASRLALCLYLSFFQTGLLAACLLSWTLGRSL